MRVRCRWLVGGTAIVLAVTGCAARGAPASRAEAPAGPTGPVLRVETTKGTFWIALFSKEAPRLTRIFQERAADGIFRQEGFWLTRREVVQLGSPATDVTDSGARDVRSGAPWAAALRDPVSLPFRATLGAFGFEFTGLKPVAGSVMIEQRFFASGQLFRRQYFVALEPGVRRGEVFAQVISGLEVVRRLNRFDAIRDVREE
jgi:cyclophilin family peptidyl-prolyl cis-trans isomerase